MWTNYRINWLLSGSLCLHRRHGYCRPFRRRWRTLLPYWRATQGGPIRRTFSVNNRRTIGGQSWLYYPLCVSRRIDTWQIVYLSYMDPCPTISIHKSTFMSHECTRDQHPFSRQLRTGTGPALVLHKCWNTITKHVSAFRPSTLRISNRIVSILLNCLHFEFSLCIAWWVVSLLVTPETGPMNNTLIYGSKTLPTNGASGLE